MLMPVSCWYSFASTSANSSNASGSLHSKVFRIFQPIEALTVDVHDVSLQVLSMFSCSWSNSVKYFDHDQ